MKTEIIHKEKVFEPIELKITIENKTDLAWLFAIANSNTATAKENAKHNYHILDILNNFDEDINKPQMTFFYAINKIAKDNDLV